MIEVTLTTDELHQAVAVAAQRRISCIFGRKVAQHYDDLDGGEWSTEIESCCAEIAVAKWMGLYWAGGVFSGKRAEHDVGNKQVRHTVYPNGCLIIYPEDNPDDRYILVTGKAPTYRIVGWMLGREVMRAGKESDWWKLPVKKRSPSWWVPQKCLRAMPQRVAA